MRGLEKKFEFLEHIADAYIAAYGRTLEEAFENAALAMFEVMTDTSKVEAKVERTLEASGYDEYELLYDWLEKLLIEYYSDNLVFSKFKVESIERTPEGFRLRGKAMGEVFDPSRHESRVEVKAVTYSLMEIYRKNKIYVLKFVLDI